MGDEKRVVVAFEHKLSFGNNTSKVVAAANLML